LDRHASPSLGEEWRRGVEKSLKPALSEAIEKRPTGSATIAYEFSCRFLSGRAHRGYERLPVLLSGTTFRGGSVGEGTFKPRALSNARRVSGIGSLSSS